MTMLVPWNICAICTHTHWAFPASIAWAPKSELMPAALDTKALEGAPSEGGRTWDKQIKAWVVFDVALVSVLHMRRSLLNATSI